MFSKTILSSAPHGPGVYLMLNNKSAVIYVGKAKNIFNRLSSYAHFTGSRHNKTAVMLNQVVKVNTIITATEKEALILEASLIKKYKPKYNIILRDDKNYPHIKVTIQEEWPRVFMTRKKLKDGARYFGPYSSVSAMWTTLKLISNLFPLRNCKGGKLRKRSRPCLNRQIGKCLAPCAGNADKQAYLTNVKHILMLLEGRNHDLIRKLQAKMHRASKDLNFEKAATLRDQVTALTKTLEKQVISANHTKDQDIFGFARENAAVTVAILFIRNGLINGSRTFFLPDPYGEDQSILSQAINQFYSNNSVPPQEILLPFKPTDFDLLGESLNDSCIYKIRLKIPKRGDKHRLIAMANTNALQLFAEKEKKRRSWQTLSTTMEKKLRLARSPAKVECLDISNIGGKQAVGSLVAFHRGEPAKPFFRHYKIKTITGPDDYGMMREVLTRRLSRGLQENTLPDLFIVDGGKGQLGIALAVAKNLNIENDLDWIGIAKEKDNEGEKLYKPGRKNPILLQSHDPILLYLMRIRDEAHRFGITFHRKLRNKATLSSQLDSIPGIGLEKKKLLLKQLGSLKRIKEASIEELMEVKGIGTTLAQDIHSFFHH